MDAAVNTGRRRENLMETTNLPRRTWVYCMLPKAYEMADCSCGNQDTQWSEFENHLWCEKCQKDFIPEHNGVLDGPIPVHLAKMMGMQFDRIIIETGKVERFNVSIGKWKKEECHETGNTGHSTGEA